jgi:AcrR family transcriptional regulator
MTEAARSGLRERKKVRTRAAIQDAALRLYLRKGYAATTVHEIAEAADVSESTFFRYFPTKPETVLYDRLDPLFIESFIEQPPELTPIEALRSALYDVLGGLDPDALRLEQTRWQLVSSVPELKSSLMSRFESDSRMFAAAVAERAGRRPDDFEVLAFTGALIGCIAAVFFGWRADADGDLAAFIERVLTQFEAGFPL